jgi:hypothetical protein
MFIKKILGENPFQQQDLPVSPCNNDTRECQYVTASANIFCRNRQIDMFPGLQIYEIFYPPTIKPSFAELFLAEFFRSLHAGRYAVLFQYSHNHGIDIRVIGRDSQGIDERINRQFCTVNRNGNCVIISRSRCIVEYGIPVQHGNIPCKRAGAGMGDRKLHRGYAGCKCQRMRADDLLLYNDRRRRIRAGECYEREYYQEWVFHRC